MASPSRYMRTLSHLEFTNNVTNALAVQRNFDPVTLQPTNYCNGQSYDFNFHFSPSNNTGFVQNFLVDPSAAYSAVADGPLNSGQYYTGLTFDDVGGLRFLFSQSNHANEYLPPGCTGAGSGWVDGVTRPGIGKLTFTRMPWDSTNNKFTRRTNFFTDYYFSMGPPGDTNLVQQNMKRVIVQPDFLFRAQDSIPTLSFFQKKPFLRGLNNGFTTDASSWQKNSSINGPSSDKDGPGVIQGPIEITFNDFSRFIRVAGTNQGPAYSGIPFQNIFIFNQWGSFTDTTNVVAFNSAPTNVVSATVRTTISPSGSLEWILFGNINGVYRIDSSPVLTNWTPKLTFTNTDGVFTFTNGVTSVREFYRVVKIGQE
ncbi:MAG: hypothetical protein JWM68_5707 [Verrucomicrobiales bacterium]|nr:hypothetical protein [Verrucomicrobiales bacterium]